MASDGVYGRESMGSQGRISGKCVARRSIRIWRGVREVSMGRGIKGRKVGEGWGIRGRDSREVMVSMKGEV